MESKRSRSGRQFSREIKTLELFRYIIIHLNIVIKCLNFNSLIIALKDFIATIFSTYTNTFSVMITPFDKLNSDQFNSLSESIYRPLPENYCIYMISLILEEK